MIEGGMKWADWLALQLNRLFDERGQPSVGRCRKIPSNITPATVRDGIRKSTYPLADATVADAPTQGGK